LESTFLVFYFSDDENSVAPSGVECGRTLLALLGVSVVCGYFLPVTLLSLVPTSHCW